MMRTLYKKLLNRKIRENIKLVKNRAPIENINLRLVPEFLQRKVALREGLVKDVYKKGDYIVSINSMYGDIILLSDDYKNGDTKISYKQIWEGSDELYQEYDDWNGGSLSYIPPIIGRYDKWYTMFRLATNKEIELCQRRKLYN